MSYLIQVSPVAGLEGAIQDSSGTGPEPFGALVIGSHDQIFLYDLQRQSRHELTNASWTWFQVHGVAYHQDTLWIAHGQNFGFTGIGCRNDPQAHPRPDASWALAVFNGVLYDGGQYGIYETLTDKPLVTPSQLHRKGLRMVTHFLHYAGQPMAACETKRRCRSFQYFQRQGDAASLVKGPPSLHFRMQGVSSKSSLIGNHVEISGHLVTADMGLSIDRMNVFRKHVQFRSGMIPMGGASYWSLAYDAAASCLYAGFASMEARELHALTVRPSPHGLELIDKRVLPATFPYPPDHLLGVTRHEADTLLGRA